MCLTIPKKVVGFEKNVVEIVPYNSKRVQQVSAIIKVKKGDWVFTQNNIITNKISCKQAQEIIKLLKK